MKSRVTIFLLLLSPISIGQSTVSEYFENMSILPWVKGERSVLTSGFNEYFFDLNNDGSDDLSLYMNMYINGVQSSNLIQLQTYNGYRVLMDSTYVEHYQMVNVQSEVIDTSRLTVVAKRFIDEDTIDISVFKATHALINKFYSSINPYLIASNVTLFRDRTSYIVLENEAGFLTILKVHVNHGNTITILEARTNEFLDYFNEVILYPNPTSDMIMLIGSYEKIAIHALNGALVLEMEPTAANPEIDIKNLAQGEYVVTCFQGEHRANYRFVKAN